MTDPAPALGDLTAEVLQSLAAPAGDVTEHELADALDLDPAEWRRARDTGLIPAPDHGAAWSRDAADRILQRAEQIRARIPSQPLGAARCAQILTEHTGLDVQRGDVVWLAALGAVRESGEFHGNTLYDVDELHALLATPEGRDLVAQVVEERLAGVGAGAGERRHPWRDAAKTVECVKCGADPGQDCWGVTRRDGTRAPRVRVHQERLDAVRVTDEEDDEEA